MKFPSLLFFAFLAVANAQSDATALGALKLLPKDATKRLARIEGRDGAPLPERWHFLAHDPDSPRGLREFVVAGGKLVASRTLSQFADYLKPSDVVGADSVKIDSDQISRLAALYAAANGSRMGTVNYELARDPTAACAVWRATVLDDNGDQLGMLTVHSLKGVVLNHDGFEKEPAPEPLKIPTSSGPALPPIRAGVAPAPLGESSRRHPVRVATPVATQPTSNSGPLNRIGNSVKRLFGADREKPEKPPR